MPRIEEPLSDEEPNSRKRHAEGDDKEPRKHFLLFISTISPRVL